MKNSIKEFRSKHDIPIDAFAKEFEITVDELTKIESNSQEISLSLANKIAIRLGRSLEDLFELEGSVTIKDKSVWFAGIVGHLAEEIDRPYEETRRILDRSGLAHKVISSYDVLHTQGYEYIAENLAEKIYKLQAG